MKRKRISQYLRCVIIYEEFSHTRTLHYAVYSDYVDEFVQMIEDTFVHPIIAFTDIIYSYDSRDYFQLN